jgi:isopenicillin N synthase-like dioxygenase
MAEAQRVEIGFEGGQVVSARLSDDELKGLRKQVEKGGWYDVKTEEGILSVYLGKVAFLRIDSGEHRVGFSLNRPD